MTTDPAEAAPLRFELRKGEVTRAGVAHARPISDAARVGRAVAFLLLGLVGAVACLLIPVLHLITTWALPLAGAVAAAHALRTRVRVGAVRGECPSCGQEVDLEVASTTEAVQALCPGCRTLIEVAPAPEAPRASG